MLSKRLIRLRESAGLSQAQTARASYGLYRGGRGKYLPITQGYLSRLESGNERNPGYETIRTLCRVYGVDATTLTGITAPKPGKGNGNEGANTGSSESNT